MGKIAMQYRVLLSKDSRTQLDQLLPKKREVCLKILDALKINPYLGKKLSGPMEGSYAIRAWPLRIIYKILKQEICVYVVDIGHRKDVYW